MARIIQSQSAESISTKLLPPVANGLIAIHLLNTSLEKAARNYALGQPDAVVVGTPVAHDGYISFLSLTNYLQTQVPEPTQGTFLTVAKTTSNLSTISLRPMYWGTYQNPAVAGGGNTYGISLAHNSAADITLFASRGTSTSDDTSAASVAPLASPGSWALTVSSVPASGSTHLINETSAEAGTPGASLPRFPSVGKFRVGSGYQDFAGVSDMALWVAYNRVLTDDETATMVDWCRTYAATRGITV